MNAASSTAAVSYAEEEAVRPTRTFETEAQYRQRYRQLWAQFAREHQAPTLLAYAEWLLARCASVKAASFRQYRSASVFVLEDQMMRESASALERLDGAKALALLRSPTETVAASYLSDSSSKEGPRSALERRTSAMKAKSARSEDWHHLLQALACSRNRHAPWVRLLLLAGLVTGLRPSEWLNSVLFHDPASPFWTLTVANGKNSNGRSHGLTRTLRWSEAGPETKAVADWLVYLDKALPGRDPERWRELYAGGRACLYEMNRHLWPRRRRHICFYTTRHIFSANAKMIYTREELGALLGHATDLTATRHYARASRGHGGLRLAALPVPDPSEVARVRLVFKEALERAKRQDQTSALSLDEQEMLPKRLPRPSL